jgi:type I restriction enzyme M protein
MQLAEELKDRKMAKEFTQAEINSIVWKACDSFRGAVDPSEYKNYILTMLFLKYLTDLWLDKREEYSRKYKGDATRVKRAMERERFILPENCGFDYLYANREAANIGELINTALERIEDANKSKLENVFRNIDFNSEAALGQTKDRNRRLKNLLEDFRGSDERPLDLRPSHLSNRDVIGDCYEYLIERFAAGAGKKAGEFYTPKEVSILLAKLVEPKPGDKICDPACGSGSLLIRTAKEIVEADGSPSRNFSLFGQESNGSTWALSRMNMFLHEMDSARIEWCDTITNPRLVEDDQLMKYNVVVANPPFSLDKWGAETADSDQYKRFWRGIPPKSKGDFAFITHMIETALTGEGRVGVIVPHGVLFRGGSEGLIRQKLVDENLLDVVVGLPAGLFFGTGIPAAILVFRKDKKKRNVMFIDASHEFVDAKNRSFLGEDHIAKIVKTYKKRKNVDKYAYVADFAEIEENDFNLNIPRYVDTFEEEEEIDVRAVQKEIDGLEKELASVQKEITGYLKELGL